MKLLCIMCESIVLDDISGQELPGHDLLKFDPSPATFSAQSLWLMQTPLPLPPTAANPYAGDSWFTEKDMIGKRFKTRICSNFWPRKYDPSPIDPEVSDNVNKVVGIEPNNHQWKTFISYLSGPRAHDWLIYWPTIGHCGYRIGCENSGIPVDIRQTASMWFDLIRDEVLPRVPEYLTLILSDHGSARKHNKAAFSSGFIYVDHRIPTKPPAAELHWQDGRILIEGVLCS